MKTATQRNDKDIYFFAAGWHFAGIHVRFAAMLEPSEYGLHHSHDRRRWLPKIVSATQGGSSRRPSSDPT
jgi:hypothetical protein